MSREEQVATVYRATFAPRTDDYVHWVRRGDDAHWERARQPMTVERVVEGLLHPGATLSAYMEDGEGMTHVGAVDFDAADGLERAYSAARLLDDAGGHAYVEPSRRGAHLWVVASGLIPGRTMRLALRWVVEADHEGAGRDPKVEIMPKRTERRGPDHVGSPLRMPMMAHPVTHQRAVLRRSDGTPLGANYGDVVLAVEETDAGLLKALADALPLPIEEVIVPDWARRPAMEAGDVVAVLGSVGVRAVPGRSTRCPLHDDRHASLQVARDSERVWCKSPSCVAYNGGRGLGAHQLTKALNIAATVTA